MKPRVCLTSDNFLKMAKQEGRPVIFTEKTLLMGHMYVLTAQDYVYYSYSQEPILLPNGIEIITAVNVQF